MQNIAIVPMNTNIQVATIYHDLKNKFQQQTCQFFEPAKLWQKEPIDKNEIMAFMLEQEKKHATNLYFLSAEKNEINYQILSSVEQCILITDSDDSLILEGLVDAILPENASFNYMTKSLAIFYKQANSLLQVEALTQKHSFHCIYHLKTQNDIHSLMRIITGQARGLVLGGCGARGWFHVGLIKAIYELNYEIDVIGGTSIGALLGAFFALNDNYNGFKSAVDNLAKQAEKLNLFDFTIPIMSLLNGKRQMRHLKALFGDLRIENMPRNFYCIACNLSKNSEKIYRQGLLWEALRASMALPGLLPPLERQGDLLIDGGALNTLPANVMQQILDYRSQIIGVNILPWQYTKTQFAFPSGRQDSATDDQGNPEFACRSHILWNEYQAASEDRSWYGDLSFPECHPSDQELTRERICS
jgi:predicted acylesterase/phospholipase RssA